MPEDTVETRLARIETKLDIAIAEQAQQRKDIRWLSSEAWLHRGGLGVVIFIATKLKLIGLTLG